MDRLEDSLVVADFLNSFIRHANVLIANLFPLSVPALTFRLGSTF